MGFNALNKAEEDLVSANVSKLRKKRQFTGTLTRQFLDSKHQAGHVYPKIQKPPGNTMKTNELHTIGTPGFDKGLKNIEVIGAFKKHVTQIKYPQEKF